MHRRTPSGGAILGDLLAGLPPRSPLALGTMPGLRTPPTCPASPLYGPAYGSTSGLGGAVTPTSGASTPVRSRRVSCNALVLDIAPPPSTHLLSSLVGSVYESNLTAAQCYNSYGRAPQPGMHAGPSAPPLVGGHGEMANPNLNASAANAAAAAAGIPLGPAPTHNHSRFGPLAGPGAHDSGGMAELSDIDDINFGLAACLATPMDPGRTLGSRLMPLPATTTAARSAAVKLTTANDILNDASRYGDWVRRSRRRRRLEVMQGALTGLGGHATLGRLLDDTLHEYGMGSKAAAGSGVGTGSRRGSKGGSGGGSGGSRAGSNGGAAVGSRGSSRGGAAVAGAYGGGGGVGSAVMAAEVGVGAAVRKPLQPQVVAAAMSAVVEAGEQQLELESEEWGSTSSGEPEQRGEAAAALGAVQEAEEEGEEEEEEFGEGRYEEEDEFEFDNDFAGFRDDMAFVM